MQVLYKASLLIAVAAAGILAWKVWAVHHENKQLHQEVLALKTERTVLAEQLNQANANASKVKAENAPNSNAIPDQKPESVVKSLNFKSLPAVQMQQKTSKSSTTSSQPIAETPTLPRSKEVPSPVSTPNVPEAALGQTPATAIVETALPKADSGATPVDSTQATEVNAALATPSVSSPNAETPQALDSLVALVEKLKDSISTQAEIAQVIKPVVSKSKRFSIGTQTVVGLVQPRQKGVSALRGQGITVEAKLLRGLFVQASLDWMRYEVCTPGFFPKFHPHHDSLPEPPDGGWGGGGGGGGGPQHDSKLVRVESTPRQQHLGLGIKYELPVKFWAKPSLKLSHQWVHGSSTSITYKFEKDDPGGPGPNPDPHEHESKYTAEQFDNQWLSNQWRFGIGLEKTLPNWTFGLWADYSKDFTASTPSFDAVYFRAGAQYRF